MSGTSPSLTPAFAAPAKWRDSTWETGLGTPAGLAGEPRLGSGGGWEWFYYLVQNML